MGSSLRSSAYLNLSMSPRIRPLDGKETQHQTQGSTCVHIGVLKLWAYLSSVHRKKCMWGCRGTILQVGGGSQNKGSDSGVSLLKGMVLSRTSRMLSAVVEEGLGFLFTGETTLSLLSVEPKA